MSPQLRFPPERSEATVTTEPQSDPQSESPPEQFEATQVQKSQSTPSAQQSESSSYTAELAITNSTSAENHTSYQNNQTQPPLLSIAKIGALLVGYVVALTVIGTGRGVHFFIDLLSP